MSLIIVKQEKDMIYIAADTKLTYEGIENHPEQKMASPGEGVIKATLITSNICICFAGDIEGVDELISFCRGIKDLLRILKALLEFHLSCSGRTEFILAVSQHPFYRIFEIKDLQKIESKSSWIGSKKGFSEFQRYWMEGLSAHPTMGLDFNMGEGFRKVMESNVDETVNGFLISVSNEHGVFDYKSKMQISIVPQVLPPGYSTIGHGPPQKGGYSVHFFPPSRDFTVLPIHVLQGNFGVIYKAKNGGLLWPEVIPNVDEQAFAVITVSKYCISHRGSGPSMNNLR
jgi:hypothetical protein